jgi:hypothetical protein
MTVRKQTFSITHNSITHKLLDRYEPKHKQNILEGQSHTKQPASTVRGEVNVNSIQNVI